MPQTANNSRQASSNRPMKSIVWICGNTQLNSFASQALILTGQPLNEPIVGHGPFVMNTREEISQAIKDYQAGRMGSIPPGLSQT